MPRYDYQCPHCEMVFEVMHGITEDPVYACPGPEACKNCPAEGDPPILERMICTNFSVVMKSCIPDTPPNTGSSVMGPDDETPHKISNKMSTDTKMKVMRDRYKIRDATMKMMCEDAKYEKHRKAGYVNPKLLKKMYSRGMIKKTPSRTDLERPKGSQK